MKFKNLIILDVQKNLNISENNCNYINLASGSINFTNSKQILIKKYLDKYYKLYKKKLISHLKQKIKSSTNKFLEECEVFNLRNDKELFLNKLIIILIIKKFIIKKNKTVKIITDDFFTYKVFLKMNLEVNYYGKTKKSYDFSVIKILKFYIKTLILLIFEKFTKKQKLKRNYENLYFSMYPNFYIGNKETFFKKDKDLKINFLLTDETHLNTKIGVVKSVLKKFKGKNTLNIESFIYFSDIFKLILFLPYNMIYNFYNLNRKLIIEDCDFSDFYKHYINISLINRFKLEIYKNSFARFQRKFPDIKNFHYYMFEYSLGFFLCNLIKDNYKKIQLIGYQHGIFSDNIMWLDLIKDNKKYLPNKIIALNKVCAEDYKRITKKYNVYLNKKEKNFKFTLKIKKSENQKKNKVLILTGTHDAKDIYNLVKNTKKRNKKDIYFFKFHPRVKIDFLQNTFMRKIEKVNNQTFSKVLISQTSTLVYDFIKIKKKFNTISLDYRPNLTSSKLKKSYEITL
tara:strand:- start:9586 stop:11124 length:1539 start_codon:yes stop_codon:yes gene_type:complete